MKRLALLSVLVATACQGPPTVSIDLRRADNTPPLAALARLRMIVRVCGQNELALAENIVVGAPLPSLEAAVTPGDFFYVWLQGWDPCNPPCEPDSLEAMNEQRCVCIDDGESAPAQIFRYETCSNWVDAADDALIPLTLETVRKDDRLCPPAPRISCEE